MTDILPRTDEDFVRHLRERIDASAPDVRVHTARVVPAARRTRRRRRATALVAGVALVGVGVGWATQPWADQAPEIAPATAPPSTLTDAPPAPADSAPTSADDASALGPGWPDAPYWHVRYEILESVGNGETSLNVHENWLGNDRPSLLVMDGDLESATAAGPGSWQWLLLDGESVMVDWATLYTLPTDPEELEPILRANFGLYGGFRTPEDAVLGSAMNLLKASPAPPALRDALWTIVTDLPTTSPLGDVHDTQGRLGEGLEYVGDGLVERFVYDPVGHRLLEISGRTASEQRHEDGSTSQEWIETRNTYLDEGPADAPPKEPRLEGSGCVDWETC
ncbi:hypothetical protein [Cellulosimicrobium cellulans]|uniref:hypothetical protein n=1 Tax=Cellulosimicrobium cellulans TaxID=1710 RepID=UPI0008491A07|nr:hypothetical protein [Cellulosimicrobium cellulans]